jgi:hypothetical protein
MPEEKQDVKQESSSALAKAIASSPEALEQQSQDTQTGTGQQPESQEQKQQQVSQQEEKFGFDDPRHPDHPRFKQLMDEKRWYQQQLEKVLQERQAQQQGQLQDPYAGMTPEEERFWRAVDHRAEKIAEQKIKQVSPVIDAGRMELAQLKVQQFRTTHPDVKANSPEEVAIAEKIQLGYLPEDAYRAVMWDKVKPQAEQQAKQEAKQKIEAKKQANVEKSSLPAGTGLPTKDNLTQRQRIEKVAAELGI